MKNNEYIEVHLEELGKYLPSVNPDSSSEEFFISKVSEGNELKALQHPFRFDGYFAYFCVRGQFKAEINLRQFDISNGTLLLYVPGHIVSLPNFNDVENTRFVVVAVTRKILQNSKINFAVLYDEAMSVFSNPCIKMKPEEVDICRSYYRLSEKLVYADRPRLEESLIDLGASLFHFLGSLWTERIAEGLTLTNNSLRTKLVFERFMKLVSEYHIKEREVGFYADILNISPKYLSLLVKKISGQSAPEWISSFVILEAKNFLKYSNLDVKEIASKLNFSSTPVFFRYFKAHTGMTPLEYRKS